MSNSFIKYPYDPQAMTHGWTAAYALSKSIPHTATQPLQNQVGTPLPLFLLYTIIYLYHSAAILYFYA